MNPYLNQDKVLHNKLGITDKKILEMVEYDITTQKQHAILQGTALPHLQGYGLTRQQAIHQYLFEDIYEWAGKVRTIPYSKLNSDTGLTTVFAEPNQIEPRWQQLEHTIQQFITHPNLSHEQKITQLAQIFAEANHLHPFPEGNGRSLQIFMKQLANEQQLDLDYSKNNAQEWNHASAVSGLYGRVVEKNQQKFLHKYATNLEPIIKIFHQMAIIYSKPVA